MAGMPQTVQSQRVIGSRGSRPRRQNRFNVAKGRKWPAEGIYSRESKSNMRVRKTALSVFRPRIKMEQRNMQQARIGVSVTAMAIVCTPYFGGIARAQSIDPERL